MNKFLVVLAGPTASGKTKTGIQLAKYFDSEIISADSRQIYKETKIGTAVPSEEDLNEIRHHFIREISLEDYYNASMYEQDVLSRLDELFRQKDIVFMVGGSGLYINAVCFGIDDLPTINPELRQELLETFEKEGTETLAEKLKEIDPESYRSIDLRNHYRILKALEVSIQTGRPYSSFLTRKKASRDFGIIRLALDMDREILYHRINQRVENMIRDGLIDEVKSLEKYRHKNAMKTVGYREIFQYLDNTISLDESVDLIKRHTRKYARKQLTWFRKDNLFPWFHPDQTEEMLEKIERTVNTMKGS